MTTVSKLAPNAQKALNIISAFGCISNDQLTEILQKDSDRPVKPIISFLTRDRYAVFKNDILFPFPAKNKIDWELIDCIWVAIDKSRNDDGTYDTDSLANSFSNSPVSIVMNSSKDNITYNILEITEGNIDSKMPFIIERFKKEHRGMDIKKIKNIQYIFVVKEQNIIPLIAEYELPMPNKIALLSEDQNTVKKVRYLSKK